MTTFLILVALIGGGAYGQHIIAHQKKTLQAETRYWKHRAIRDEVKMRLPKPYAQKVDGVTIANLAPTHTQDVNHD